MRGQCWKIFGPKHDIQTKRSETLLHGLKNNIEYFRTLLVNVYSRNTIFQYFIFPSQSFSLDQLKITWLYQRQSIRLLQTDKEPIRLYRCRSEQPYFRTPYNNASITDRFHQSSWRFKWYQDIKAPGAQLLASFEIQGYTYLIVTSTIKAIKVFQVMLKLKFYFILLTFTGPFLVLLFSLVSFYYFRASSLRGSRGSSRV